MPLLEPVQEAGFRELPILFSVSISVVSVSSVFNLLFGYARMPRRVLRVESSFFPKRQSVTYSVLRYQSSVRRRPSSMEVVASKPRSSLARVGSMRRLGIMVGWLVSYSILAFS